MGLSKKLTEQQIKFAHELVANEGKITATRAAELAGYAIGSARKRAHELQNPKYYPLVVDYLNKLRLEKRDKYEILLSKHIVELNDIAEQAKELAKNNLKEGKIKNVNNLCKKMAPLLNLPVNQKPIKVYLAEEARPFHTNHFKIGRTIQKNVSDRGKFTDNPYGMNYICYIEYLATNGFNLEKNLHNFFRFFSTNNKTYNGSTEWFLVKNRDKLITTFKKVGMRLLEKNKCMGVFNYEVE
tara:strand:+ start:59 stop:781 length:723 start_codon:yes stop_codon:yes gene_type:complete